MTDYKRITYIILAGILSITIMFLLVVHSFNHTTESGEKFPEKESIIYYGD